MYPPMIAAIAADQVRERTERAERYRRARQVRAAAREPGGLAIGRAEVAIFRLRLAMLRAAAPATRLPQ